MINLLLQSQRLLKKNKGFLFLNIAGLAIGLTATILLLLFALNEWSYDRHFTKKDRIVRLNSIWIENGEKRVHPICLRPAFTEIPKNVPGIEAAVQLYSSTEEVCRNKERFQNIELLYSDPDFFRIFDMPFIYGSPEKALQEPKSAVLTRKQAEKIFGKTNPIGQTFTINQEIYTVTGVVKDMPENTHFQFDLLASMNSLSDLNDLVALEFYTYYLVDPKVKFQGVCESIEQKYKIMLQTHFNDRVTSSFDAATEKLTDIHLFSNVMYDLGRQGSIKEVLVVFGLAILILLLAISNFINLFIVQGNTRIAEVGIRKANGAGIKEISIQFFSEVTFIVLSAFILSLLLVQLFLPYFSWLIGKIIPSMLMFHPVFAIALIVLLLITIVLSTCYPVFYLSRLKPAVISKKFSSPINSKPWLSTFIVMFQSVVSIILTTVLLIVYQQSSYLKNIPLGYRTEGVMMITNINEQIKNHYKALKQDLLNIPGIKEVGSAQHVIGWGPSGQSIYLQNESSDNRRSVAEYRVLAGACEVMEFQLKEGRFFRENPNDSNTIILNEEAVKMLNLKVPIGQRVVMHSNPLEVIGVVKNFYYKSTAYKIGALVLTNYQQVPNHVYIKFASDVNKTEAAKKALASFRRFDRGFVLDAVWSDNIFLNKFNNEKMMAKIISASTLLAIILAMMGLFAIHSFMVARRTKEIGLRKVSGSTTVSVIRLLSLHVFKWIGISALVAFPIAWWIGERWLQNYANRIHTGIIILLIPVLMQGFVALLATFAITYKAATRNPIRALRYE